MMFYMGWSQTIEVCEAAQESLPSTGPIVSGLDGWLFRKADLRIDPDLTTAIPHLLQLREMLKAKGTELVIVPTPMRSVVYSEYLDRTDTFAKTFSAEDAERAHLDFLADLDKNNILNVDALVIAQDMLNNSDGINYFFKWDIHWTPMGAKHTAEAVADLLKLSPSYQSLPKALFVTKKIETQDFDSGFRQPLKETL
jgi:alginate biosynthesis protein AlgX